MLLQTLKKFHCGVLSSKSYIYKFTYAYLINIRAHFIELVFFQTDIFAQTPVNFFIEGSDIHFTKRVYQCLKIFTELIQRTDI
jgi:hypothetical protein